MRTGLKEFIGMLTLLILVFLILAHYTGFSRDVNALGSNTIGLVKVLQGRG